MSYRALCMSIIAICSIFAVQYFTWSQWSLVDRHVWEDRITLFQTQLKTGDFDASNEIYSGHPGMSIITIGSGIQTLLHKDVRPALAITVSLLVALTITAAGITAHALRPTLPWWPVGALILTAHPLFIGTTPTNAIIAPLIALFALLILWIYEHPDKAKSWIPSIAGAILGMAVVTRIPTTGLIALPFLVLLANKQYIRSLLIILGTGIITALILDPLFILDPYGHINYIFFRTSLNYTEHVLIYPLTLTIIATRVPFSILSIILGVALTFRKVRTKHTPPARFIYAMLASTALLVIGIYTVRTQSIRYLIPIAFMWDVFLPLFLINLISHKSVRILRPVYLLVFLALAQLSLFIHMLFIPTI